MFHEDIAQITADHLREHIAVLLDGINARYPEATNLVVPKSVEVTSVVGGLFTQYDKILPQYGIDILTKELAPTSESVYTYLYSGQINGMVHGRSQDAVDKMTHRHGAAVEQFVREHLTLHQVPEPFSTKEFTILEFDFAGIEWSGAEDLGEVEGVQIWLGAFSLNTLWLVSEEGPGQHE